MNAMVVGMVDGDGDGDGGWMGYGHHGEWAMITIECALHHPIFACTKRKGKKSTP